MQNLKVTIVQTDLVWENAQQNRKNFDHKLSGLKDNQDLIVLPEMFNTAFCLDPNSCAEDMNGDTINWLVNKAKELNCSITGSVLIKEDHKFFNRLIWATPQGIETTYDKKHLFRFAGEHKVFSPGSGKAIVTCKGWKILPLVCYDLRLEHEHILRRSIRIRLHRVCCQLARKTSKFVAIAFGCTSYRKSGLCDRR